MFASEIGISHFQPSAMSWSKRYRGNVERNQMYPKMKAETFARNHTTPGTTSRKSKAFTFGNGGSQPPKNTVTATQEMMIIAVYSPRKKKANFTPEYSVLKPETSSDSASGRSNGLRLVSATPDTK